MIRTLMLAFLATASVALPRNSARAGCTVSVNNGLGDPQALVLKPGSSTNGNEAHYWPSNGDSIVFQENDVVVLACPGGYVKVSGGSTDKESAEATCKSGSFSINGATVAFNKITCSRLPYHSARYTGNSCLGSNREVEIGFGLETGRFVRHITICFDDNLQNTLYTQFTLSKGIEGIQSGFPRPDFIEDNFYHVGSNKVDDLYKRNTQRVTVNALVGLPASSTKYIHESNDYFMSRGHLTAKADFIYGTQQQATFHYVNVAPQWQTFNGANWNTLEQDVQDYVGRKDQDHTVYTGTHGVTTLPHENSGADIPIYFYVDGNEKGLPVPQFFWKVLYNPATKAGIAFVGINNPYHADVSSEIICENICNKLSWLTWKPTDIPKGYSYCCTVDDLRKTVTNMPAIDVQSILV